MNEEFKKALEDTLAEWGVTDGDKKEFLADLGKRLEASDKNGDTEEKIEEAKEEISEEGKDSQSEKDRIDESVGEKISEEGEKDKQSTKDRVNEAEGEEKAEDKKAPDGGPSLSDMEEVEEPAEEKKEEPKSIEKPEEKPIEKPAEEKKVGYDDYEALQKRVAELEKIVEKMGKAPKPVVDKEDRSKLERLQRQYSN